MAKIESLTLVSRGDFTLLRLAIINGYHSTKKSLASTPMRALYSLRISSSNFTRYALFLFLEARNLFITSSLVATLFIA